MTSKSELKINELKVSDLKVQLEKRGLDVTGNKPVLLVRLRNALEEEGIDPEEYDFKQDKESTRSSRQKSDISEDPQMENGDKDMSDNENSINDDDAQFDDDEEYDKGQEDTESARFRTSSQSRSEMNVDESSPENKEEVAAPAKDGESAAENAPETPTEGADDDDANSKSSKDKAQQASLIAKTLWVTGLTMASKVTDLKNLFAKHGKVAVAKIVRSTKGTQRRWYGLLTMATSKDASKCIEKLHRTDFGGNIISVERRQIAPIVKKTEALATKKSLPKAESKEAHVAEDEGAAEAPEKSPRPSKEKDEDVDRRSSDRERDYRGGYERRGYIRGRYNRGYFRRPFGGSFRGRDSSFRGRSSFRGGFRRPFGRPSSFDRPGFRSFSRGGFRDRGGRPPHREYMRDRDRDFRMKDEDELYHRSKMIQRRQEEEAYRLEREKTKLRLERELLERERSQMLKLEREKQRIEREALELEREKLKRKMSYEFSSSKRPFIRRGGGPGFFHEKRRDDSYSGPSTSSFHREKYAEGGEKFQYNREYKKPEFVSHDEYRHDKGEGSSGHQRFMDRDTRREVSYRGDTERHVYPKGEFRGAPPGTKIQREDWKYQDRRSGDKPGGFAPRGRKFNYY